MYAVLRDTNYPTELNCGLDQDQSDNSCQAQSTVRLFLSARRYAGAGISYWPVCVSVCLSVCHTSILYRNGCTDGADF